MKHYWKNLRLLLTDWRSLDKFERIDLMVDLSLVSVSLGVLFYAVCVISL